MATYSRIEDMKLVGGGLCFDFANTVGGRVPAESGRGKRAFAVVRDKLGGYADLVTWGRRVGLLTGTEARRLLRAAEGRPDEAAAALARGVAMREAAFHIFRAIVDGRPPDAAGLETLNRELQVARRHERLVHTRDGFVWQWDEREGALDCVLWPVARSAAEFLASGDLNRVKACGGAECGWIFVDISRNRSRQWCDMQDCGNLAKVRRFRQRWQREE